MKHKKVFAILTLMCFLFTLVPMTAFAANEFEEGQVYISTTADSYKTRATVNAYDKFTVFVGTAKDSVTASGYSFIVVDEDGDGVAVSNSNEFQLKTPGTYTVYALDQSWGSNITNYIESVNLKSEIIEVLMEVYEDELEAIGVATVKVKAAADFKITLSGDGVKSSSKSGYDYEYATKANNGFNAATLTATVSYQDNADSTHKVTDATLTYRTNSSYVTVEKVDSVTDRRGEADFKIAAAKDGDYKVTVSYEDASVNIYVTVSNATEKTIEAVTIPTTPVALDTNIADSGIEFEIRDENGSLVEVADATPKVTVVSAPADSNLADETLILTEDDGVWILGEENGDTVIFDEEGEYTFKASLKNGASATASVTVKEFGDPVSLKLTYKSKNVAPGGSVQVKKAQLTDANGVTKTASDAGYTVVYAANGIGVAGIDAGNGKITAKTTNDLAEEKLIGSTITAIAICDELELTATAEIKVVEAATALKFASTTAELAVNNSIKINTVNDSGTSVTTKLSSAKVIVLSAPENAVYATDVTVNNNKGTITLNFTASVAGEYTLQAIATTSDNLYLGGTATITVGAEEGAFQDVIVLSIGSNQMIKNGELCTMPTAAKIENGRTMVPFRAALEAFGAVVTWDAEARTATAELNGITVVMTIDSTSYTISGVTHTADMAPYIDNGSTMVPLVFFTNAFGIHATVITAEDGSVSDVLFAK